MSNFDKTQVTLNNNTLLKSYCHVRNNTTINPRTNAISPNFYANNLAQIYNFPNPVSKPIVIGVISLGGGLFGSVDKNGILTAGDLQKYWTSLGITNQPTVIIVSLDGATNSPDSNLNATIENTVDVETIGACCYGTNVTIIFYIAPNSFESFYNLFNIAINNPVSVNGVNIKPTIISCSWGAPEKLFSPTDLNKFDSLFLLAKNAGINICCASGDNGSSDGLPGLNVDFPASSPNVVACGGTNLVCPDLVYNNNTRETAWSGSGGGLSNTFASPAYQVELQQTTRAVPDLALNADPSTGVIYLINNKNYTIGGTSIVSPMVSAYLGAIGSSSFFLPSLYAMKSSAFHDIISGSNGGYTAKAGYDFCTGLGSINGIEIQNKLTNWSSVASVSILPTSTTIQIGQTLQLIASVSPLTATNKSVFWKSNNTSIATVSSSGLVKGLTAGQVVITLTANDTTNGLKTYTYTVTILSSSSISILSILLPATLSLNLAQTTTLSVNFIPVNTTNKSIAWTSSNSSIVSVNTNGVVTGIANGIAIITATSVDGGKKASTTVTVQTPVTSITFGVGLSIGKTLTLIPTVNPITASNKTITWSSLNSSRATVSQSGVVTGIALGTVTIRATASNGIFTTYIITIVS